MDRAGTSRLSADLKFGTISVRTVWNAAKDGLADAPDQLTKFHNELLWREFAHGLLWTRPDLLEQPFRRDFEGFPWRTDAKGWHAWTTGTTGYPVVDASARQLMAEGYVHNRARMISASFLTKHLLISYREGEAHYMRYLTDGDWAQNNAGWQWSAGCGCDAQPYFRVFNPTSQGERFDPDGGYVRRWVPELAKVPAKYIHAPAEAPADVLAAAGVRIGVTYPRPIVEHAASRARFLAVAKEHLGRAG
jgi:deoxyribodipyrimidine photo-lyase